MHPIWQPILVAIIAIASFAVYKYEPLCTLCSQRSCPTTADLHSGYFEYECAGKPHHSSWTSWWHPQRSEGTPSEHRQGAGAITNDWNILYHLGGNGPWVEKVIDIVDGGIAVPDGCHVEQVHMVGHEQWLAHEGDIVC
jgi:acid phosphatase